MKAEERTKQTAISVKAVIDAYLTDQIRQAEQEAMERVFDAIDKLIDEEVEFQNETVALVYEKEDIDRLRNEMLSESPTKKE